MTYTMVNSNINTILFPVFKQCIEDKMQINLSNMNELLSKPSQD